MGLATTLPIATVALVVIGGPPAWAAQCCKPTSDIPALDRPTSSTLARSCPWLWVAGPPLATFIIGWFGNRAILLAIAAVAVLNIATTAIMISHRGRSVQTAATDDIRPASSAVAPDESPIGRLGVVLIMVAFILLQATNAAAMTIIDRLRDRDTAARRDVGRNRARCRRCSRGGPPSCSLAG